jgi:hypothetical protein
MLFTPSTPRVAGRALAIALSAGLLGGSIAYATGSVGSPAPRATSGANAIHLSDSDGDRPLFSLAAMAPGQSASGCIAVTNDSPVPVDVALNGAATGSLGGFLGLQVERGGGTQAVNGACDGFIREADVYSGSLADFPARGTLGVADGTMAAGATRVYRYTTSLGTDGAAQGLSSNVSFDFSGTGEPPAHKPAPGPAPADVPIEIATKPGEVCTTYFLQGGRMQRSVKLSRRVKALLVISKVGTGRKQRLRLSTSLKTAAGKVLINRGWASVTYLRNGRRIAVAKRRPFGVNIRPSSLRTGTNRLKVMVRDRHRKVIRATFRLISTKALLRNQTVCVFRAATAKR